MMQRIRVYLALGLLSVSVTVWSGSPQTIVLQDGSQLTGEVLSLNGGTYQIRTASMGVLAVPQNTVLSIGGSGTSAGATTDYSAAAAELQGLQQSIASNPAIMQTIQSLQSDPQFQAILQDPEIMQAVQSGNFGALSQNPKIQQLMNHSAVQGIARQLGQ